MRTAIQIENLSKLYRIGAQQKGGYRTLRESIVEAAGSAFRRLRQLRPWGAARQGDDNGAEDGDSIWALKDFSLDVPHGEVIGIVGRNGAGKSTLLKVLSRITEPTSGRVRMHGRVGSLLEVGTGFHPELTGRENIFLNGAILGMTRREIIRKFDDIVAFSEIDRLLDTPVKRYSSGTYMRLAFAVASHLDLEILVVDEVLAVGDHAFQKKCLGKMGEVSRSGRTVLFVSHNMAAILNLCQRVAILERGRLQFVGGCEEGIAHYLSRCGNPVGADIDLSQHPNRRPGSQTIYHRLRLRDSAGNLTDQFHCGDGLSFEVEIDPAAAGRALECAVVVEDAFGSRMFTLGTYLCAESPPTLQGRGRLVCHVQELALAPGRYSVSLWAGPIQQLGVDVVEQAAWFDVMEADFYGNGRIPRAERGRFVVRSRWEAEDLAQAVPRNEDLAIMPSTNGKG